MKRSWPIPWLLSMVLLAPASAQEAPHDEAAMVVEYRRGEGISVAEILRAWANRPRCAWRGGLEYRACGSLDHDFVA